MTSNVIVSIGRNIGAEPMSDKDWQAFIKSVRTEVAMLGTNIWFEGVGNGAYQGAAKIHEEAYTVIGDIGAGVSLTAFEVALADLAALYQQDCVAITYAAPKFVEAQFA